MASRKTNIIFITAVFLSCFFFSLAAAFGSFLWSESFFYHKMAAVAAAMPDRQTELMQALKDTENYDLMAGREILRRYGYYGHLPSGNLHAKLWLGSLAAACIGTAGIQLFACNGRKKLKERIGSLTEYLRQMDEGDYFIPLEKNQDLFSNLEDEIYKTVLALRESREELKKEKENLARNLADISHQFKTPLTSLSVLCELLRRKATEEDALLAIGKMEVQAGRLSSLATALLTLSRADAGVLPFEIRNVPISELLSCALEPIWPLLDEKNQKIRIYGTGDIFLCCDLGWMKEALANILKNASEHAPEQSEIGIRVWENPVYIGIAIEDEGTGFSEKDLPHLFERFYRGETAKKDSIGIGLSLAKSLSENQKGEIRAENRKEGGGRFLIKFYKNM